MNNAIIIRWRRRVAAMRIFHLLAMSSVLVAIVLTVAKPLRDVMAGQSAQLGIDGVGAMLLATSVGIVFYRLYKFYAFCEHELPGSQIDLENFVALQDLQVEIRSFLGIDERLQFHCLFSPDALPARIFRSADGSLRVLLSFGMLCQGAADSGLVAAVVWHEVGHYLQWDTSLGRWTLRASEVFGKLVMAFGTAVVVLVFGGEAVVVTLNGWAALTGNILTALGLLCGSVGFLVAVFFGVRFWCRFSEFNCDLTATIGGYGKSLAAYLRKNREHRSFLQKVGGFHPDGRKRAALVDQLLKRLSTAEPFLLDIPDNTKLGRIHVRDYLWGGVVYVAPIFFGFQLTAIFLSNFITRWMQTH